MKASPSKKPETNVFNFTLPGMESLVTRPKVKLEPAPRLHIKERRTAPCGCVVGYTTDGEGVIFKPCDDPECDVKLNPHFQ